MKGYLSAYIQQQKAALESIQVEKVETVISLFQKALREDRQVFVFGNGGSACNASHFITDLGKSASDKAYRRFRCLSLNDNVSWITAIGNDYAYEDVFVRQLENYARPGDVAMVMSVSGNSPNLVKAVEWCRQHQVHTVALVGGNGGKLAALGNDVLVVNDTHYGRVEDCHMHIAHMICYAFIELEALQQPAS
jgi:D-sedoheptulose 7-phosphate isomerase